MHWFLIISFLICTSAQAKRSILPDLFGMRLTPIKITLFASEEIPEQKVHYLQEFPCEQEDSFWGTGMRISDRRSAVLRLNCLYPPTTILVAVQERFSNCPKLTENSEVHALLRCPLTEDEKKPDNYRTLDMKECIDEPFLPTLPDTQ
ncbi:MAG: hypothetical protein JXR30_03940 [Alphaproteobacteria bacterium]|nr:hypothetical protein [Alphaproteobacteria bacterium]